MNEDTAANPNPLPQSPPKEPELPIQPEGNQQPQEPNTLLKKIGDAADGVLKKFNIKRKGRGRPKNDGTPKKSDLVEEIPVAAAAAPAMAVAPVSPASRPLDYSQGGVPADAAIVQKAVEASFRTVIGFSERRLTSLTNRAVKLGLIPKSEADDLIGDAQASKAEIEQFGEFIEICTRGNEKIRKLMPAAGAIGIPASVLLRQGALANAMGKKIKETAPPQAAPPPKTVPPPPEPEADGENTFRHPVL